MRLFKKEPQVRLDSSTGCVHGVLVPRWDDLSDMGNEGKASSFLCEACGSSLTPAEAGTARAAEAARLNRS